MFNAHVRGLTRPIRHLAAILVLQQKLRGLLRGRQVSRNPVPTRAGRMTVKVLVSLKGRNQTRMTTQVFFIKYVDDCVFFVISLVFLSYDILIGSLFLCLLCIVLGEKKINV